MTVEQKDQTCWDCRHFLATTGTLGYGKYTPGPEYEVTPEGMVWWLGSRFPVSTGINDTGSTSRRRPGPGQTP